MKLNLHVFFCGILLTCSPLASTLTAQPQTDQTDRQEADPRHRELSDKQQRASQKAMRQELKGSYKTWLEQDVSYIITADERKAFLSLGNDEERESFIEQFWRRRNPAPDSPENTFRDEHYRRIQYANDHFSAGKPGWETDRGRVYISWGPPDSIDAHPSMGLYDRPPEEGGGQTSAYPYEIWNYRRLEGVGGNINLEFVDTCQCGDYHFTIDRSEKDAFKYLPDSGLTQDEIFLHLKKEDRSSHGGYEQLGNNGLSETNASNEFDRLLLEAKIFEPPPIKFKDLDAFISEHKVLPGPAFPFDVRTDFVKVTGGMDLVPITIQIRHRDITYVTKDGVSRGIVNILGKVTTITHRTVQTFEEAVEVQPQPDELVERTRSFSSVYWKVLPLPPGLYRLDIVVKDVNNPDHIGIYGSGVEVPSYPDDKLGASSLILADKMKEVSSREIGTGNFVLGNMYVRPRVSTNQTTVPVSFKRVQDLNFWIQFYNLGIDEKTRSNDARMSYQIVDAASGNVVFEKQMNSRQINAHSDQITMSQTLPLSGLPLGKYNIKVKIDDNVLKQQITQTANFIVE